MPLDPYDGIDLPNIEQNDQNQRSEANNRVSEQD